MASQRARFLTTQKIGEKRRLTPEGFLVIEDVPIARIGMQEYHTSEVGLPGDAQGIVKVHRTEAEVFRPEHILSYNGKPVVNDHPSEEEGDVTPDNYRTLTCGNVNNTHRGTGDQSDLLLADFIICDAQAIADVNEGKREVSCGYSADYNELELGVGEQVNLIGNHVALVDAGRCGSRCSIGDKKHSQCHQGDSAMKFRDKKPAWLDRLLRAKDKLIAAYKAKDAEEIKKAEEEVKDAEEAATTAAAAPAGEREDHTHVHIHGTGDDTPPNLNEGAPARMTDEDITKNFGDLRGTMDKFGKTLDAIANHVGYKAEDAEATEEIEGQLADEAPEGMQDKARKARDSAYLGDSLQSAAATAEILVPGIAIPAYVKTAAPKKTFDAICGLRRNALDLLNATAPGRAMVEAIHGRRLVLDGMRCGDVRALFNAVGALKKQQNRQGNSGERVILRDASTNANKPMSVADIQKANEAFWDARRKKRTA